MPGWLLGDREPPEERFTPEELPKLEDLRELVRIGAYYQDYPDGQNLDRLYFVRWLMLHRGAFNEWGIPDAGEDGPGADEHR